MAVKHVKHIRYELRLMQFEVAPEALAWCHDNCLSTWDANYRWWSAKQCHCWLFSFDEEYDKAAFILKWL